jgi:3-oxoacyl-[acyl-carrier-protein] synthase-3
VVGASDDPARFAVIDHETESETDYYGTMYMAGEKRDKLYTSPVFQITDAGAAGFVAFGEKVPPEVANRLLARRGLKGSDVTLITHQASSVLMDEWQATIQPAAYLQTLEAYANMTLATIAVDLAWGYGQIKTDHVLLLALGPEMHANAVLLRRG